ncbi:hypothetical protein KCG44_10900 [Pacificimonas sp. WHA3]|uniref:Periplasmic heavy metal sensor n=1 Tax=Pacificimonas pallii TaxID=2827236 RepID=A0ABS6SH99_9SPHN|nr:hypothetical protein [Pacificimonas pallii]MBV7257291.1 hypothetical protein [Pacificimonas pallii]
MKTHLIFAALIGLAIGAPAAAQQPFGGLSEEGRAILAAAMTRQHAPGHDQAVSRARARVLQLLSAEELDVNAIAEAQRAERTLVMRDHARAHERMLTAYEKLSSSDRRAFAAALAYREARVRQQMERARNRMELLDRMMVRQQRNLENMRSGQRPPAQQVSD